MEKNKKYAHETEVAKIFSQKDGVRKPINVKRDVMECSWSRYPVQEPQQFQ